MHMNKIYSSFLYSNALIVLFCGILFVGMVLPFVAFGQNPPPTPAAYVPLAGLPQAVGPNGSSGIANYLNRLYIFLIIVGAIIAAIKISIAGAKYAFSDIITDKSSAKKDIQGVLIGLAILLIPFIVLSAIYSPLTNLNILQLGP
jgi:hypothetical protein